MSVEHAATSPGETVHREAGGSSVTVERSRLTFCVGLRGGRNHDDVVVEPTGIGVHIQGGSVRRRVTVEQAPDDLFSSGARRTPPARDAVGAHRERVEVAVAGPGDLQNLR